MIHCSSLKLVHIPYDLLNCMPNNYYFMKFMYLTTYDMIVYEIWCLRKHLSMKHGHTPNVSNVCVLNVGSGNWCLCWKHVICVCIYTNTILGQGSRPGAHILGQCLDLQREQKRKKHITHKVSLKTFSRVYGRHVIDTMWCVLSSMISSLALLIFFPLLLSIFRWGMS